MSDRILKRDRIQQLQQQIETWQALLEKLGGSDTKSALARLLTKS